MKTAKRHPEVRFPRKITRRQRFVRKRIKEEYYDTADLDYTDTETIYIDDEDAILDSIKVKKDQKVNKGDVLAVYHVETLKTKRRRKRS